MPRSSALTGNRRPTTACGFTLVEVLVASAILLVLVVLMFQFTSKSSDLWRQTSGRVGAFQAARAAFESITRNLSQATLQTSLGYADASGRPVPLVNPSFRLPGGSDYRDRLPSQYLRNSELHFVSGPAAGLFSGAGITGLQTSGHAMFFQAPLGFVETTRFNQLQSLLSICGYYVEFGDAAMTPDFMTSAPPVPRYRLMEVLQPAERSLIYQSTNAVDGDGFPIINYDLNWMTGLSLAGGNNRRVLAENVLLLLFLPKLAPEDEKRLGGSGDGSLLAPDYAYDSRLWEKEPVPSVRANRSRNQLPPIVEVVMVAIDEVSARRLEDKSGQSPPLANESLRSTIGLDHFTNPANLDGVNGDLARMESGLQTLGLSYRIFRTEVRIQGAKWSD